MTADGDAGPAALWRATLARHPAHLTSLRLLARCGEALPAVLRGAAETAAEPGAAVLAELYDADPLFRRGSEAVARMLRRIGDGLPAGRMLRVLALAGAETAGMPADRIECVVADPQQSLSDQGLGVASYDAVVAGVALAASGESERDLAAAGDLLKPGGLFIAAVPRPCALLELAAAVYPALGDAVATDWRGALGDAGFEDCAMSDAATGAVGAVLVARKPAVSLTPDDEPPASAIWVLVSDGRLNDATAALAGRLRERGQRVVVAEGAACGDRGCYAGLLRSLDADDGERLHLVYLCGVAESEPSDPAAFGCGDDLLSLVQAVVDCRPAPTAALAIVTAGALPAGGRQGGASRPWQAPLWGLGRTVINERPDIACRLIDLDPEADAAAQTDALCRELVHPDDENEILLRGGARYAPRLCPGFEPQPGGSVGFDRPGADEVSIRIHAAGVNFRDVVQRIGMLPEEAFAGGFAGAAAGLECAGEVIAAGERVKHLRPGDAVFGFVRNGFSRTLVAPALGVLRKPPSLDFAAAATLPVAAVTAYYSLHHLARLAPGERLLVHGAAGGVGLAAVQYAQAVGAEIFGSAGTAEKRAFLRRLGVQHVVDSRSLAFADAIREMTEGKGVDVVLNSLAGEAIRKSLSILRPHGRFIELGKRDFHADSKIGLGLFRNNIQFCAVDLDRLLADRPALARQLFDELAMLIDRGVFTPLPHRVYPLARADEAFRAMQQSRHIGKLVLSVAGEADDAPPLTPVPARPRTALRLPADAAYLVTGGRGGFGLATAGWLARKGARHLALVGRSRATAPDTAAAFDRLRRDGVDIREFAADVAEPAALAEVLSEMRRTFPPLRGVIHAAAVIRDGGLAGMTATDFHDVLRPKMAGAWNLHQQTRAAPLDFFVMYSSAVTLFGNEGQANYVAANLYLEALAGYRRSLGLPALTVAWGAIGETGHMARHPGLAERVKDRLGVGLSAPARALDRLEDALAADAGFAALAELSWPHLARLPGVAAAPKYAPLRALMQVPDSDVGAAGAAEIRAWLAGLPREAALAMLRERLAGRIAEIVGSTPATLAPDRPLIDLGMDSLMLVELQLGLEKQFGIVVPTLDLVGLGTVEKLAERIAEELGVAPVAMDASPNAQSPGADRPELEFELTLARLIEERRDRDGGAADGSQRDE